MSDLGDPTENAEHNAHYAALSECRSRLMRLGMRHFRMQAETLGVEPLPFSDDELHALQTPALLLIGQEVLYDPALALGFVLLRPDYP